MTYFSIRFIFILGCVAHKIIICSNREWFIYKFEMSALLVILLSSVFFFVQGITNLLFPYYFISVIPVNSQVVSFNCTTFCPEVPAIYHCVITSSIPRLTVSGSVSGANSFAGNADIGDTIPIGSSFTAIKTGSTSFSLNFTAKIDFNNSVTVECLDLSGGNGRQCTIELEGKKVK